MPLPLIPHLYFARSEFKRALEGLSDTEARRLSQRRAREKSMFHVKHSQA